MQVLRKFVKNTRQCDEGHNLPEMLYCPGNARCQVFFEIMRRDDGETVLCATEMRMPGFQSFICCLGVFRLGGRRLEMKLNMAM
jgi:hypothetical protein